MTPDPAETAQTLAWLVALSWSCDRPDPAPLDARDGAMARRAADVIRRLVREAEGREKGGEK